VSDPAERPARFHVGVVGAGRVGAVLGAALRQAGHRVVGVSAVSERSLERAASLLPGIPVMPVREVVSTAELVLLAVPDDALAELVSGLSATGAFHPGQVVVHASGIHGTAVLEPAVTRQALPLALHPAIDLDRLVDCSFAVTTLKSLRPLGEALVLEMGGEPVWIEEEDRPVYHAALSHGSNHLVTLVAQSMELLARSGVEQPDRVLSPLLHAALDNALRMGDSALTGPIARGDAGTVAEHAAQLVSAAPDIRATYLELARATAGRAVIAGRLSAAAAEPLFAVLREPTPD